MITLITKPNERGTAVFTIAFTDENDNTVVPNTAAWQLMQTDGTVVNERSFENCSLTETTVVLSGDDLQLFDNDDRERIFAVQATYDSDVGSDLSLNDEVKFKITNLVSQS